MGIRGRDGRALTDHWADGPTTFLGIQTRGFPNLFFPGGPHAASGNNPRYNGDQVDFVTELLVAARERGCDIIETSARSEERWTRMVDKGAAQTTFGTIGQYVGGNIPGKPRRYLLNTGGRPKLFEIIADTRADDYKAFEMTRSANVATADGSTDDGPAGDRPVEQRTATAFLGALASTPPPGREVLDQIEAAQRGDAPPAGRRLD